jgi:hypothetical protein
MESQQNYVNNVMGVHVKEVLYTPSYPPYKGDKSKFRM